MIETQQAFQLQLQLITGWLQIPEILKKFELEAASKRSGVDLHDIFFYRTANADDAEDRTLPISRRSQERESWFLQEKIWRQLLRNSQGSRNEEEVHPRKWIGVQNTVMPGYQALKRVPAYDVCYSMITKANTGAPSWFTPIAVFFCFALTAIPVSLWLLDDNDKYEDHIRIVLIIYYVSSSLLNFQLWLTICFFFAVAVADLYRRYKIFEMLGQMLRTSDLDQRVKFSTASHSSRRKVSVSVSPSSSVESPRRESIVLASTPALLFVRRLSSLVPGPEENEEVIHDHVSSEGSHSMLSGESPEENVTNGESIEQTRNYETEQRSVEPTKMTLPKQNKDDFRGNLESSNSFSEFRSYVHTDIPRINFNILSNINSWCSCRLVMYDFGSRFRLRIDIYTGLLLTRTAENGLSNSLCF